MTLPIPDLGTLLLAGLAAMLAAGMLAPFEALGWWAGWFGPEQAAPADDTDGAAEAAADGYVVFLTGIHSVGGEAFAPRERAFLERLRAELPDLHVIEVFPYSVTNRALTAQRLFAGFWRWALARKMSRRQLAGVAGMVINLRNAWQVAVSADRRYGPMYDEGSADLIETTLRAAGYRPRSGAPVVLIGYSGGGQIALGATAPLAARTARTVSVVSLGGVMASPRTVDGLARLVHLRGSNDLVARIGGAFFPGRWPIWRWSTWNRSIERGLIRTVDLGPMDHTGRDGYLDDETSLEDGRSYLDATVATVVGVVREALSEPPERARAERQPS
jgi:pimeloyl-ACP methyl ester carboxylesterase